MKNLRYLPLIFIFFTILFKYPAYSQDFVRLGKAGELNQSYGVFHAVNIKEIKGVTYAFCATSRGMAVFRIHYEKTNQDITNTEVSLISFVHLGECTDIEIEERGGYEKDIYAYITVKDKGLYIRNVTNPSFSYHIGSCNTPGDTRGITISGDYAFVADGDEGLPVIQISDQSRPVIIGNYDTPGFAQGVTLSGEYAFIAGGYGGLQVIYISDPNMLSFVGMCNVPVAAEGVAISGDYAIVADGGSGLKVIDISDPNEPESVSSLDTPDKATGVAISGVYAFVADEEGGLQVIDISDPNLPESVGSCDTPGEAIGIAISGVYAFVADEEGGLQVIDISDPSDPVIVGSYNTYAEAIGVAISGVYALVADDKGLQVIDSSDPNGPVIVGSYKIPGSVKGFAVSGDYAFVVYSFLLGPFQSKSCLLVIDISNPTGPVSVCSYEINHMAKKVAISGDYAFVVYTYPSPQNKGGFQVIDISDPTGPVSIGSYEIPGDAMGVAISGDYALLVYSYGYAFPRKSRLQVIDISEPNVPISVGSCEIPNEGKGVAISGDYAFVVHFGQWVWWKQESGLQVIHINDPTGPVIVGSCKIPGVAQGVVVSGDYAFVAAREDGLQVIDISEPNVPISVGSYDTPGFATEVAVSGDYAFIADGESGFLKLKIIIDPQPEGKGNLILVAGGNINYKTLSQQTESSFLSINTDQFDHFETNVSYWEITQALANYVFNRFINSGYEVYDIYYFNPDSVQDTDNNGIPNQLVVDEINPTREKLMGIIEKFPKDHIENPGPLYIYLIGHGVEDKFLIMANEIITAQELRDAIDRFQNGYTDNDGTYHPGTNRRVAVIIESGASGTFIDDLTGPDITVITSTGDGASYIKPVTGGGLSYIKPVIKDELSYIKPIAGEGLSYIESISTGQDTHYNSFTTAFINRLAPYLDSSSIPDGTPDDVASHINVSLKEAFLSARNQLETWALSGPPFDDQAPQMVLPAQRLSALYFSEDGITPIGYIPIDSVAEDIPYSLTLIGKDPNHTYLPIPHQEMEITFFSSDPAILDPESTEDIQKTGSGYEITPRKNGRIILIAHADPNLLLSAKLTIEVSVNDPNYDADLSRMAIIAAGYKGTGDYLWESTNNIANHAYNTLRAMGYTKDEIHYYNPYFIQDLDENGEFDEIDGYPKLTIFDPNAQQITQPFPFARIRHSDAGLKELFIFLADHGTRGKFYLNPNESLTADYFIDQINGIANKVKNKIIFLYDASYSESFLREIEKKMDMDPNSALSEKLLTITSTDSNQIAYYLNKGIVSFSYPFFDEWYMTNSLTRAFSYAKETLPYADPNLSEGQTPCISDPNLAESWDRDTKYYMDESRPVFGQVQAYRSKGILHLTANVFSLTGIKEIFAIVERANNSLTSLYGVGITEGPLYYLSARFNDPNAYAYGGDYELTVHDPCPNEENYNITIYAMDNNELPKMASYKTGISEPIQNRTKALIIASDPGLFQTLEEQQRLSVQIGSAEAILERKGLSKTYGDIFTVSGQDINSQGELWNTFSAPLPLAEGQTFFIFLIGHSELDPNSIPYFYINPNLILTPQQFSAHIPQGPNERLLILMDAPYAKQFLSAIDPNTLPRDWTGIASTDKGHLFFPLKGRFFPCFSSFFFSMVLSGATVSHAYRMAENAVSLTRQRPGLFLPEKIIDTDTINRHLGYYLGTSVNRGEDYSLFKEFGAQSVTQNGEYHLSFPAHPDADINNAWAVLNSQTDIFQERYVMDFYQNYPEMIQEAESVPIYYANVSPNLSKGEQYYNAFFIVEGRLKGKNNLLNTWTKWQNVHLSQVITQIEHDDFEPDDDPNQIFLDKPHEQKIIVNTQPQKHTFYCKETEVCNDIDFVSFYALKGQTYEIYAQDRSKNDYFIQLALYDPNIRLLYEKGEPLISNNYLAFFCNQSGYYILKIQLASNYPSKGVKYTVGIYNSCGEKITRLLLELVDPLKRGRHCVKGQIENDVRDPSNYRFNYPDEYYYKFNKLRPNYDITIKVHNRDQCEDQCKNPCNGDPLAQVTIKLIHNFLNPVTIDLPSTIDPNIIIIPPGYGYDEIYNETIGACKSDINNDPSYPWKGIILPGDMDPNFPPEGDYDGDQITNIDEVFVYSSLSHFPTFLLFLYKGINLYYHSNGFSQVKSSDQFQVYSYNNPLKTWQWKEDKVIKPDKFNAIYNSHGGVLYYEPIGRNNPLFCLKGLMDPNYFPQQDPNGHLNQIGHLNENEVWSQFIQIEERTDSVFPELRWDPNEIAGDIGSVALITGDPNRLGLLVKDMSDTNSYQTKETDATVYFPSISAALFSYAIVPEPPVTYYRDADYDGYGDPNDSIYALKQPPGYVPQSGDCDDQDPNVYHNAPEICDGKDNDCDQIIPLNELEVCDGKDNDCDGEVDEEGCTIYYKDEDNDGQGVEGDSRCLCSPDEHDKYTAIYSGDPDDLDPNMQGTPFTGNMSLHAGWNMISLPLNPQSTLVSDVFPGARIVYGYDKDSGYEIVEDGEDLEVGKGYWIRLNTNQSYTISGQPIQSNPLPVYEDGWDMIGGCTFPVKASVDNGNIVLIYGYVLGVGYIRLLESENLEPGNGYWILVNGVSN